MVDKIELSTHPVHLGLGAIARVLPTFDGTQEWYERYGTDAASDGAEGRLVSLHTFAQSWDSWEMHPEGHELVVCVVGEVTLIQETADAHEAITLSAGEAVINDPGVWHTADVAQGGSCTCLFVTAGLGTQARPR